MRNHIDETVILLHGLFRTGRDMATLARFLAGHGYETCSPTIPCTVKPPGECADLFWDWYRLREPWKNRVHFVGHSMGGIVLRLFLEQHRPDNLGRCVLLAVPNTGTPIADIACRMIGPLRRLLKGLDAVRAGAGEQVPGRCPKSVTFGTIGGTGGSWLLSPFFTGLHDGRVPLCSAHHAPAEDMLTLAYPHTRIHKKRETALFIDRYLRTGRFHQ